MSPYGGTGARAVWKLIYIHNPFYLISAFLVLLGCQLSFETVDETGRVSWMLMACLVVYTTLLAGTGYLIIRFGGVWEDARMILLVLVLMFLALASSFDRLVMVNFQAGCAILLLGLTFSILVSEGVLRSVRIRLPWPWRGPYYLILGLLYVYPIWIARTIDNMPTRQDLAWRMLLFSPTAAVALLTLIPAARRGRNQPRDHGTPWPWPLFPWSLFVMLAVGIVLRMYFLNLSFDPVADDRPTVQPYFFVPLLAAILLVALELALAAGWRRVVPWCLALPLLLPLLAMFTGEPYGPGRLFLKMLLNRAGSPLFLTLWLVAVFYAYTFWRLRMPVGLVGFWMTTAALICVGPSTVNLAQLAAPQWAPLAALAALHLTMAIRWRRSFDWLLTGMLGLALASLLARDTWFTAYGAVIPWHLAIAILLGIGALRDDFFSRLVRTVGALALCIACLAALWGGEAIFSSPAWGLACYETGLLLVAAMYAYAIVSPVYWFAAAINIVVCAAFASWKILANLSASPHGQGAHLLAAGGLCLLIAAIISFAKGGYGRKAIARISWRC